MNLGTERFKGTDLYFPGLEIKGTGQKVELPPSWKPDKNGQAKEYIWSNDPLVGGIRDMPDWLREMCRRGQELIDKDRKEFSPSPTDYDADQSITAWGKARVERNCEIVASTEEGDRNISSTLQLSKSVRVSLQVKSTRIGLLMNFSKLARRVGCLTKMVRINAVQR